LPSWYRTVCYWSVCYRTVQWANHIQSSIFNQPITFKVVITCVIACTRLLFCFWPLITGRRCLVLKCFHLLCRYFFANFPFLSSVGYYSFLGNCNFMIIGNRTSCRPIRSVIILVINTCMITDRSGLHSVLLPLHVLIIKITISSIVIGLKTTIQ